MNIATYLTLLFSVMILPTDLFGMKKVLTNEKPRSSSDSKGARKIFMSTVEQAHLTERTSSSLKSLTNALAKDDTVALEKYLALGVDATALDNKKASFLHIACYYGSTQCLRVLMKKIAHLKEATDSNGYTPLHVAVLYGKIDCLKLLLDNKVSLTAQDQNGRTAFHLAAHYDRKECLKVLYSRDATLQELTDNGNRTALHLATGSNKASCVKLLVDLNAPTRATDATGNTALHIAAAQGFTESVQALIDHDPTLIDVRDSCFGYTPLNWAVRKNKINCVWLLLKKNPQVNIGDTSLSTPLHVAAKLGFSEVLELLLENHASTEARDNKDRSALDIATQYNHPECIALLTMHQASHREIVDSKTLTKSSFGTPFPNAPAMLPFKKKMPFSKSISDTLVHEPAVEASIADKESDQSKRSHEERELKEASLEDLQNREKPSLEVKEGPVEKKSRTSDDQDFWKAFEADFNPFLLLDELSEEPVEKKPRTSDDQDFWKALEDDFNPLLLLDEVSEEPVEKNLDFGRSRFLEGIRRRFQPLTPRR